MVAVGRKFPDMIADIDPTVYFYHGGESPENRLRWISPSDTDVYAAAFTASFGTNETEGFCRCNPPWTGSPPNCVYACGKARYSVAALNVSGAMVGEAQCEECLTGSTCDELVSSIRTLPLASGYWRASWKSRSVKQCPRSGLCSGGSDSLDYCVENHRGPFILHALFGQSFHPGQQVHGLQRRNRAFTSIHRPAGGCRHLSIHIGCVQALHGFPQAHRAHSVALCDCKGEGSGDLLPDCFDDSQRVRHPLPFDLSRYVPCSHIHVAQIHVCIHSTTGLLDVFQFLNVNVCGAHWLQHLF